MNDDGQEEKLFTLKDLNRVSIKCLWDELKSQNEDQLYRVWTNYSNFQI
jgi:hypothetical protein